MLSPDTLTKSFQNWSSKLESEKRLPLTKQIGDGGDLGVAGRELLLGSFCRCFDGISNPDNLFAVNQQNTLTELS
jgi:hypothetical protein